MAQLRREASTLSLRRLAAPVFSGGVRGNRESDELNPGIHPAREGTEMHAFPFRRTALLLLLALSPFSCLDVAAENSTTRWPDRIMPLPKQFRVDGEVRLPRERVTLAVPDTSSPPVAEAVHLLARFARGQDGFRIQFVLTSDSACPDSLRRLLRGLPNADQAYAIRPILRGDRFAGLELVANGPVGLLYAARTLRQLLDPPPSPDSLRIPVVRVVDWPDLAERGEWGWNLPHDLPGIAALKMNEIEIHARLGFRPDGTPRASLDQQLLRQAQRLGVKVVPIIRHLEQLHRVGLFRYHPELAAVPPPGSSQPDHPTLCYSHPYAVTLLSEWLRQLFAYPKVTDVNVWLAELPAPCYCDRCRGQNPVVLQTRLIVTAYERVRRDFPGHHVRILLTQGSYPDNAKVLANIRPDVHIVYYHGGRTYDSSSRPMIEPLLEQFARSGGWLSVYPQLTNSWRTVFPFTGGHFIKARMTEFVQKGLQGFSGYATPSNDYYDFNIAAAAEWSWNSRGRSVEDFARAYAWRRGLPQPGVYARWADLVGRAGWKIAGSRIVEMLIFAANGQHFQDGFIEPGCFLDRPRLLRYGEGLLTEFTGQADFQRTLRQAEEALHLAQTIGDPTVLAESRCVLDVLRYVGALNDALGILSGSLSAGREHLAQALNRLDTLAARLSRTLLEWGNLVHPVQRSLLHSRFRDTVDFPGTIAGILRRKAAAWGIPDPHPERRFTPMATWTVRPGRDTLWIDVTRWAKQSGPLDVRVEFQGETGSATFHAATLCAGPQPWSSVPVDTDTWTRGLNRFGRALDAWLEVPAWPGLLSNREDRWWVGIQVSGAEPAENSESASDTLTISVRRSCRR